MSTGDSRRGRPVGAVLAPLDEPILWVPALVGGSSVASLLLYFHGVAPMGPMTRTMLVPAFVALVTLLAWCRLTGRWEIRERILAGLWAGALATVAYDVVRLPVVWSGVPVFKAISYFGTVILGVPEPTLASEVVGWAYHLSNGMGFGLLYTALVRRPGWVTAVLWGMVLEAAMLLTPYAEVFGYRLTPSFVALTLGAHAVYGLALRAALGAWLREPTFGPRGRPQPVSLCLGCLAVPLGLAGMGLDFHMRHATHIEASPPPYIGPHLYATWDVLEVDRLGAMWVLQRFVDPAAQFHVVPPFSPTRYGVPFDTPEAAVRRTGARSATEVLLEEHDLGTDPRLATLGRVTHLYEVTPWMLPADPAARKLAARFTSAAQACAPPPSACIARAFEELDAWFRSAAGSPETQPPAR